MKEGTRKTYRGDINAYNVREIFNIKSGSHEQEARKEKRIKERFELMGNERHISEGREDRKLGMEYDPNKFSNPSDQRGYLTGYILNGDFDLALRIETHKLSDEKIEEIGYEDYMNCFSNFTKEELEIIRKLRKIRDPLVKIEAYQKGFNNAAIEVMLKKLNGEKGRK